MAQVDRIDQETRLDLAQCEEAVHQRLVELLRQVVRFDNEVEKTLNPDLVSGRLELRVERVLRLVAELPVRLDLPGLVHEAGLLHAARARRRAFET